MVCVAALAVGMVGVTSTASAQYTIHQHPQKAAYAGPEEWPSHEAQMHWPDQNSVVACHVHVGVKFPSYAEIPTLAPIEVPFKLQLHNCDGALGAFWGDYFAAVLWDDTAATGGLTMPVMQGDPAGLKEWTGKVILDFSDRESDLLHIYHFPGRGWKPVPFRTRLVMANGDTVDTAIWDSVYSMLDPTAPETPAPEQGRPGVTLSARVDVISARTSTNFGEMITEINDYLPLLPITDTWPTIINVYNYTSSTPDRLTHGVFEQRFNMDLHNGVQGAITDTSVANVQGFLRPVYFDPVVLGGIGTHKVGEFWTQMATDPGNGVTETIKSVLAFDVTVGDGPIVSTTCTDPTAKNFGGVLPCIVPAPTTDVCPNIVGDQTSVPQGMVLIDGRCVAPSPTPVQSFIPGPMVQELAIDGVPQHRFFLCTAAGCSEIALKQ